MTHLTPISPVAVASAQGRAVWLVVARLPKGFPMIFAALDESALKGELRFVDGGMVRWHRRRDGVAVVREIIVLPAYRRAGVGTRLIASIGPGPMMARCPEGNEANRFWEALGWADGGLDSATRTPVRVWTRAE